MNAATARTSVWFYVWSMLIILGLCWAFLQWNHPMSERARMNLETAFQQTINWNVLSDWYNRYIDSAPVMAPKAPINDEEIHHVSGTLVHFQAPVSGEVLLPHSEARQGAVLRITGDGEVRSAAEGRVVFADEMAGIGQTLIVQHAGGIQSWYGLLEQTTFKKNDWVASGEVLGRGSPPSVDGQFLVYLAVKDGERFLDPLTVMQIE